LKELESDEEPNEMAYGDLLTTAQKILYLTPTESPDPALEREIRAIFNDQFFKSPQVKALIAGTVLLVLGYLGGTVIYGIQVKGFLSFKEEAVERMEGILGTVYIDTMTEMEERLKAIESVIQKAKVTALTMIQKATGDQEKRTGALGAIYAQKETSLAAIRNVMGDQEKGTGALGTIRIEKEDAIRTIKETIGNKDQPGTALWEIDEEKRKVIKEIDDALNGNANGGGALGDIEESGNAAISSLAHKHQEIAQQMDRLLADAPARVTNLETTISELEKKIHQSYLQLARVSDNVTEFIPVADKVQEAHRILKDGLEGVEPRKVVSLLNVSTAVLTVMSILSLLAFLLACVAIWKS
jgi:predicted  nucleic acid-binding Zn-ribbon protein